jgi:hypothetical protein
MASSPLERKNFFEKRKIMKEVVRRDSGAYMPSYWGPPPPSGGTQSMI